MFADKKQEILAKICYTELVYDRINKKLKTTLDKTAVEELIFSLIRRTEERFFEKRGKNYYITNHDLCIRITINSNTFRIITVDTVNP